MPVRWQNLSGTSLTGTGEERQVPAARPFIMKNAENLPGRTAYIDMEFAGIYGTRQRMQILTEIGIVFYDPDDDTLAFTGKAFSRRIDVERWMNVTDDLGTRIDGRRRGFSLDAPAQSKPFDRKFHIGLREQDEASRAIAGVYRDLRAFIQSLDPDVAGTLAFFACRRELEAFSQAGISLDGYHLRDLQEEIRVVTSSGKTYPWTGCPLFRESG